MEPGALRLPLQTPRLRLRALVPDDAEAMAEYRSLPEVCRYVPFHPMTPDDVRDRITGAWSTGGWSSDGGVAILGVTLADDVVVGDVMLRLASLDDGVGELGYVMHPRLAGQGLGTEAAHGVLHLAFDQAGLRRMIARVDTENVASWALLERLGMRREAHLVENEWFKGRLTDEFDYAILRREWDDQHLNEPADERRREWCPRADVPAS
ncbi:MAG TPA: GNAT family N-acetyltransferase [Acidimicrobiales bacterium]|nr:GNAT family N-acetyltransferase [Acidimicrobiales bacterium]